MYRDSDYTIVSMLSKHFQTYHSWLSRSGIQKKTRLLGQAWVSPTLTHWMVADFWFYRTWVHIQSQRLRGIITSSYHNFDYAVLLCARRPWQNGWSEGH